LLMAAFSLAIIWLKPIFDKVNQQA
jgi:hypothetical protein